MKKIVYLHGLESPQGGPKVSLLSKENLVWAPKMDYKNEEFLFEKTLERVLSINPDYIIGSSMGGYYGFMLASHLKNVKVILFNPALFDRPGKTDLERHGDWGVNGTFVLSENDRVVPPEDTVNRVIQNKKIKIEIFKDGGHQIPYYTFEYYMKKFL